MTAPFLSELDRTLNRFESSSRGLTADLHNFLDRLNGIEHSSISRSKIPGNGKIYIRAPFYIGTIDNKHNSQHPPGECSAYVYFDDITNELKNRRIHNETAFLDYKTLLIGRFARDGRKSVLLADLLANSSTWSDAIRIYLAASAVTR